MAQRLFSKTVLLLFFFCVFQFHYLATACLRKVLDFLIGLAQPGSGRAILVGLNGERLEESFLEIKTYIKSAVKALAAITSENKGNLFEIFTQLEGNVRQTKTHKIIRQIGGKGLDIISIVSSVAGFV